MSVVDLVRMGVAGAASLGAAVSGFAASQTTPDVVGVSVPRPPAVPEAIGARIMVDSGEDLARWSEAFVAQPVAVAAAETAPWRFIGVIGEGRSAKAVFASPDVAGQTVFVSAGDALPDGRVIAAVASQHVLFAAEPKTGEVRGVEEATGPATAQQIRLLSRGDASVSAIANARLEPAAMRVTIPYADSGSNR